MKRILSVVLFSLFSFSSFAENVRPVGWDSIEHIVIIIFENERAKDTLKHPFFASLSKDWGYLSNYYATTHPSQPNYIALTSGSTNGITTNRDVNLNVRHIGNLLNEKGKTWKGYAENYPGNCYTGTKSGLYYRKHFPFMSYRNVTRDEEECAKLADGRQFFTDLANNDLPAFSIYVPNMDNDGHDTNVSYADRWLSRTFGPTLKNPNVLSNTLFILTFDEDDNNASNNVYTAFIGAGVKPKTTSSVKYNHYSLLKTIENIFELGSLGKNDSTAKEISNIWLNATA